jgi:hypothetical protein
MREMIIRAATVPEGLRVEVVTKRAVEVVTERAAEAVTERAVEVVPEPEEGEGPLQPLRSPMVREGAPLDMRMRAIRQLTTL